MTSENKHGPEKYHPWKSRDYLAMDSHSRWLYTNPAAPKVGIFSLHPQIKRAKRKPGG